MSTKNKSVLLGLSGGVDSSVSAHLLLEQGFDVTGIFFKMSPEHEEEAKTAQESADTLGIPLVILDLQDKFEQKVIAPFMEAYNQGFTPNPCIICNPRVKFFELLKYADQNNISYIATGHYSSIGKVNNRFVIETATSQQRDQTYMLYMLGQDVLSRLIFPLSGYHKDRVREIAAEIGLKTANKPDSQEICFIKNQTYQEYIEKRLGKSKTGNFIGPNGHIVAKHKGILHYTVGQRKRLGIALGKPVFVKHIDGSSGDITLSFLEDNKVDTMFVNDTNFIAVTDIEAPTKVLVKVRSTAKPVPATVEKADDTLYKVTFDEPISTPAPGQAAVFYKDNLLLGGGTILKNRV